MAQYLASLTINGARIYRNVEGNDMEAALRQLKRDHPNGHAFTVWSAPHGNPIKEG